MPYSSSVTTVLQKCPEFIHFNLIATWKVQLSCPLIIFVAVIILLRFAHVIFIEINVDKVINAFTKIFFCKRCKRLSHLWMIAFCRCRSGPRLPQDHAKYTANRRGFCMLCVQPPVTVKLLLKSASPWRWAVQRRSQSTGYISAHTTLRHSRLVPLELCSTVSKLMADTHWRHRPIWGLTTSRLKTVVFTRALSAGRTFYLFGIWSFTVWYWLKHNNNNCYYANVARQLQQQCWICSFYWYVLRYIHGFY